MVQVLLDVGSIQPDRVLLLDSYFYVVVFHGTTIAAWRKAEYHLLPEQVALKQLLEARPPCRAAFHGLSTCPGQYGRCMYGLCTRACKAPLFTNDGQDIYFLACHPWSLLTQKRENSETEPLCHVCAQSPKADAAELLHKRFPVPRLVDCDQNGSQARSGAWARLLLCAATLQESDSFHKRCLHRRSSDAGAVDTPAHAFLACLAKV